MSGFTGYLKSKGAIVVLSMALAGPFVAWAGWDDGERHRRIDEHGIVAEASVKGANYTTKRGSTTWTLDLAWRDAAGKARTADKVRISTRLADSMIQDNRILVERVGIKYLPEVTGKNGVLLAEDVAEQQQLDAILLYGGGAAGALGMVGAAAMFGRRRRPA